MNYVYNYALGSILFGSLTLIFFFREKRIRDFQDKLYTLLLICAFAAVVFDALAAMLEPVSETVPRVFIYIVNMLFLFSMQTCLPGFWQYSLCAVGKLQQYSYKLRTLFTIPYFMVLACLLISPFCRYGIFYLDATNSYCPGLTHSILYVNASYYMLTSTLILVSNFKTVQKQKRAVIIIFSSLVFLSMLLQILFPRYLLTSSACMLAVSAVFYIIQSPLEMRDPLTGSYNRILLPSILHNYHQQRLSYTLLLFSLRSFDQICAVYGSEVGDEVLQRLGGTLRKDFPDDITVYMDTSEFTVLCPRAIQRDELEQINSARPRYMMSSAGRIPMELSMAAVLHDDSEAPETVLTAMDYLYQRLRVQQSGELLFADAAFQVDCAKRISLESDIGDILQNGRPHISFDPILRLGRVPCGADAILTIEHASSLDVDPARLFLACEQSGLAWRYLSLILQASAPYREQFAPERRLYIPFSLLLCMSADAPERILDAARGAGFEPSQIGFYALESQVASSSAATRECLSRISELGFALCLDAFAEGYSDIVLLTNLPISAVRISSGMFSRAAHDMRQLRLLRSTVDVLNKLDVNVICGGINSTDDASVAAAADINMIQGGFVRGAARFPRV